MAAARRRGAHSYPRQTAALLIVVAWLAAAVLADEPARSYYVASDAEIPVLADVWIKDPALDKLLSEAAGPERLVIFQVDTLRLESTRQAQATVDLLLNLAESIRSLNRTNHHVIFSRTPLFHTYVSQASYRSYLDASPGGSKPRRVLRHAINIIARGHDALFLASDHVATRDPIPLLRSRTCNVGLPEDLSSRVLFAKSDPKTAELLLQIYRNIPEEKEADEQGPDPAAPEWVGLGSVVQAVQTDATLSAMYKFCAFSRSEFPAALPPYEDVGLVSTAYAVRSGRATALGRVMELREHGLWFLYWADRYAGKYIAYDRDPRWTPDEEHRALLDALCLGVALDRAVVLPPFSCAGSPDFVPGFWPAECHASAVYDGDALAEFSPEMLVEASLLRDRFAPEGLRNGTNTLRVTLKKWISDGESIHYFKEFELDQVYHFTTLRGYFSRWENKKREKKYRAAIDAFLKRRSAPPA